MEVTQSVQRVCFVGAGYVGSTTAAVLALKNPLVNFTVVDTDASRIQSWKSRELPIIEPGLPEILAEVSEQDDDGVQVTVTERLDTHAGSLQNATLGPIFESQQKDSEKPKTTSDSIIRTRNLAFSTDIKAALARAQLIFIAVNTPSALKDEEEVDLCNFNVAIEYISKYCTGLSIIVIKSTVPCGTAQKAMAKLNERANPGASFVVLSNPEFLAAGSAIENLLNPFNVIIGSPSLAPETDPATMSLVQLFSPWISMDRVIFMSNASAELAKVANNAFQAQRISSINSLSALCEFVGADVSVVSQAIGMNPVVGPYFLEAGVGFGGSCLRKDTLGLAGLANGLKLPQIAEYWRQVTVINDFQLARFTDKVWQAAVASNAKRVAILGYAFKKNTSDTRGSLAKAIILRLLQHGLSISIYDPLISAENVKTSLFASENVHTCTTLYDACATAGIIAVLNDSTEFASIDWSRVMSTMRKGNQKNIIIDGRNIINARQARASGFLVEQLGKPISSDI